MRWVQYWGTVAVLCGLLCSAVNGCPHKCSCSGSHVDCQGQGFRTVPRGIPRNAERLDLDRNNITRITKVDFSGLKNLRVLHLENNQISVIERGAFQELRQLERIRLNRNRLQVLPELLFQSTPKLGRLSPRALYGEEKVCWREYFSWINEILILNIFLLCFESGTCFGLAVGEYFIYEFRVVNETSAIRSGPCRSKG
ncbi:hypothetical protein PO909_006704 [Leuciscus waleckii]